MSIHTLLAWAETATTGEGLGRKNPVELLMLYRRV